MQRLVPGAVLIGLTLVWPVLHGIVFRLRFGHLPEAGLAGPAVFLPMGFVSAVTFVWFWHLSGYSSPSWILLGYMAAVPLAFVGSLFGGLLMPGIVATVVFGAVPLIVGSFLGYRYGLSRQGSQVDTA